MTWWKCPGCGLFFVYPQPDDRTLASLYQRAYYEQSVDCSPAATAKSEAYWDGRAGRLAEVIQVKRVLDVGCGKGQFLAAALQRGWAVWGTELSAEALRSLPQHLGRRAVVARLEGAPFEPGSFDAMTTFDVIEHVRHPVDFLHRAHDLLRPGGVLLITTPNAGVIKARLRGRFWKYFRFERYLHLYHFTPHTLEMSLEAARFRVERWFSKAMPMIVAAKAMPSQASPRG